MYTIGEFSKIGRVTTKTLRYYDEIGLLHPASVDEETHYRYYDEKQVDDILLILELKNLDLRLEQISAVLKENNPSLLNRFLEERVKELEEQMNQNTRMRKRIEEKMNQIQSGGMTLEENLVVEVKEFAKICVMSQSATIEISNVGDIIGKVYESIFKNGLMPNGPVMTFYKDEEFNHEHANVEVCIPVTETEASNNVEGMKLLDPGLCATCTHKGEYSKLGKAYAAVFDWIDKNEYHISSAPFDVYLNSPQQIKNINELLTQVWFPISK